MAHRMVHRFYVEKKVPFQQEAASLHAELRDVLGVASLERVRILNRYDVEGIGTETLNACRYTVFAEPQTDYLPYGVPEDAHVLAVEYLPGQYDQRADAAEQCVALLSGTRPTVRMARVYLLYGALSDQDLAAVRKHLVNPVECREAQLEEYETLAAAHPQPGPVPILKGFRELDDAGLAAFVGEYGLSLTPDDLRCCRAHFRAEGRDPTLTEIRVLDTYWSDHCRHSTFHTELDSVDIEDGRIRSAWERYLALRRELGRTDRPVTLMDLATIGARALKRRGLLRHWVESEEVNACTMRISVDVDGRPEPWLLLFKNETHNHPTEIEPFGGAATCIGGAIRDPLSGRGYVYQAMRVTGAADPRRPLSETLPGKLPQRTIVTAAAAGYSAYGNQVGLPAGLVDELYHDGYVAKRMEVGAVVAAVPEGHVRRARPEPGDRVLLLGGRTGRDGCGGATGSSRAHTARSLELCGAEVQKGNAPEERKLQRLFRNPDFSRLVKRCNDFGAGGVSVAVGELADGLDVDLDSVPLKYAGLDGTEIAISESQERMAAVVAEADVERAAALAEAEGVSAATVARVSEEDRLVLRWRGERIVDLPRAFIQSNGAARHAKAFVPSPRNCTTPLPSGFAEGLRSVLSDLNVCSKRGLCERFDSTVGGNTVLMPFGGGRQRTPIQAMAAKIPVSEGETTTCSVMAWGFDPFRSSASPYDGAYLAVVESVCRLAAAGADLTACALSFQEYFGRPGDDPRRWGQPTAALLGALAAQLDLGIAAIGGKDSMSGSFEGLDVPPTLISFAVTASDARRIVSPEFKGAGSRVVLLRPRYEGALPEPESMRALLGRIAVLNASGSVRAAFTPTFGGAAAAVFKMALGNGLGFAFADGVSLADLFGAERGTFVLELEPGSCGAEPGDGFECLELGHTRPESEFSWRGERIALDDLEAAYNGTLEDIYPTRCREAPSSCRKAVEGQEEDCDLPAPSPAPEPHARVAPPVGSARPRFLIPVFPGTNCEYESARAVERAGGRAEVLVVNALSTEAMRASADRFAERLSASQALLLPGGFSNGDEPDGSGKFIAIFLRSPAVRAAVEALLGARGGLICGICNGFQALVKTGLLPYGRILDPEDPIEEPKGPAERDKSDGPDKLDRNAPTLTFNTIGRHQSRMVRTRVLSNRSPWLRRSRIGDVRTMPISHGEGRFVCPPELLRRLAEAGQVATQYVDPEGRPTMDIRYNPNGSAGAVEGLLSPDGRVFGRMGHAERVGPYLYRNVEGNYGAEMFESTVDFFKGL